MSQVQGGRANTLLGYPADARLLIFNADDLGMCHAVNAAIIRTLQEDVVQSTTIMVPCPWALHAMEFLAEHPGIPFGVHLTLISEWPSYRWGPRCSRNRVPTLVDESGFFYPYDRMAAFLAQAWIRNTSCPRAEGLPRCSSQGIWARLARNYLARRDEVPIPTLLAEIEGRQLPA
jgi:hypothetical protein